MNFNYSNTEYALAFMIGIILYLLYYVFTKDAEYSKNIRSVATVVEELNRELYYMKNKVKETQKTIIENRSRMSDTEIYQEVERTVYDMIQPISISLKRVQDNLETIDTQIDSRITSLENGVKQISIPSSVHGNDDEKIISLFKQGVSLETISKELHISKAEVEFVLKINKIK
ncbi:MAG: hypothetical protein U9P72_11535 [Campylobacterota bacterium]|nr:hypothetical protein [Campylobacterota bacterium]